MTLTPKDQHQGLAKGLRWDRLAVNGPCDVDRRGNHGRRLEAQEVRADLVEAISFQASTLERYLRARAVEMEAAKAARESQRFPSADPPAAP